MSNLGLQEWLGQNLGKKLKLKINDNQSTMLSVKWEPECTKVSIHRMFLDAPKNVMNELACYIRQEKPLMDRSIKAFIEDNLRTLDYSDRLDRSKISVKGKWYDLQKIYDSLNREYFGGKLKLLITWFGNARQRNRTRVTFGLFYDQYKLIKINRLLDSCRFPEYVVRYVVYHEMVHHVCPSFVDEYGINRMHTDAFKRKEKQFKDFEKANAWIKAHEDDLFATKF